LELGGSVEKCCWTSPSWCGTATIGGFSVSNKSLRNYKNSISLTRCRSIRRMQPWLVENDVLLLLLRLLTVADLCPIEVQNSVEVLDRLVQNLFVCLQ
jgi:hypothetical protein